MARLSEELKITSNPTLYWKIRRIYVLDCSYCKPHHMENAKKLARPDKYKSVRKGRHKRK